MNETKENLTKTVTADARELAERAYRIAMLACGRDGVLTPMDKPGIDDIAAILAPVVARAEAAERERDQLRDQLATAQENFAAAMDERNELAERLTAARKNIK